MVSNDFCQRTQILPIHLFCLKQSSFYLRSLRDLLCITSFLWTHNASYISSFSFVTYHPFAFRVPFPAFYRHTHQRYWSKIQCNIPFSFLKKTGTVFALSLLLDLFEQYFKQPVTCFCKLSEYTWRYFIMPMQLISIKMFKQPIYVFSTNFNLSKSPFPYHLISVGVIVSSTKNTLLNILVPCTFSQQCFPLNSSDWSYAL